MMLPPNKPLRFEGRNPRPGFKTLKAGHIYTINLEVDEETWNALKTMPDNAIIETVLWYHDGDVDPKTKADVTTKAESRLMDKGPFGPYWQRLFKQGFYNDLSLREVLGCEPGDVREALHKQFQVDSLTHVSPQMFEDWLNKSELVHLVTMSRQIQAHQ